MEHEDEDEDIQSEPDIYILSAEDLSIVAATKLLLRKIARHPSIDPRQMEVVAKVLGIFERLPDLSAELNAIVQLGGPQRLYGDHRISHYWTITVEKHSIEVSSGGSFYRPSTGGDSFTCMQWMAAPGYEAHFWDYLDSLRIVDDVQPYEEEVKRLAISEPGYSISVELDGELIESPEVDDENDEEPDFSPEAEGLQPCDESERILAAGADEAGGRRRGEFSFDNPDRCDLCNTDLTIRKFYVNARHRGQRIWSNMCSRCFLGVGEGLGTGNGQLFSRQPNGKWLWVGGFPSDDDE